MIAGMSLRREIENQKCKLKLTNVAEREKNEMKWRKHVGGFEEGWKGLLGMGKA
jgi:hypothetical protein